MILCWWEQLTVEYMCSWFVYLGSVISNIEESTKDAWPCDPAVNDNNILVLLYYIKYIFLQTLNLSRDFQNLTNLYAWL